MNLPKSFVWRGRRFNVQAIERRKVILRGRQAIRLHLQIRCAEGTFEVYQDVRRNTWYMLRKVR